MSYLAAATDQTSALSDILVKTHKSQAIDATSHIQRLDSFLKDARQINKSIAELLSYARAIRAPYLSTAPLPTRTQKHARLPSQSHAVPSYLNDAQREDIVAQTTALLNDVRGNIQSLEKVEATRHEVATKLLEKKYGKPPTNFLFKWAAGGEDPAETDAGKTDQQITDEGTEKTLHDFRGSVVLYLSEWYDKATTAFKEMVDKRRAREAEKKASALYDSRNRNVKVQQSFEGSTGYNEDASYANFDVRGRDAYNPALDPYSQSGEQELSPEQLQLFEEENSSLMQHYNETLTQVTQVEKSLFEISSLQQTLIGHLETQGEMIGGLVEDAEKTEENVTRGNKELKRATEKTSTAKIMYHTTLYLCLGLVVWDLIF